MKKINKIVVLSLLTGLIMPSISRASEIVKYDDSNLDQILIDNGIEVDQDAVIKRKEENKAIEGDINNTKELIEEVKEEGQQAAIVYPKTAVYSNVVDLSEHQNPDAINYDEFSKDIDGAILRASITTYKEDKKTKEKTYYLRKDLAVDRHYENLSKRNVPIGFYHYSRAVNQEEALIEANYILNYIKDKNVSLPIYIDIEDDIRQAKASKESLSKAADAFVLALKRNGYVAGIYSYPYFANNHLTKEVRDKNEFWIADYVAKDFTGYKETDFDMWQYTHTGKVNGYVGNLDKNILYRDYPYIIKGKSYKDIDKLVTEIIDGHWSTGKEREDRLTYAGYDYKYIQQLVNKRLKLI